MKNILRPLSVLSTCMMCVSSLVSCSPIAQLITPESGTNRATVRFSSLTGDATGLNLSSFDPDRIEGTGQAIPAFLGQAGQGQMALPTYTTTLILSSGSGTKQSRSVGLQVGEKLVPGYSCALGLPVSGGGTLNICNLTYNSNQQNLTAKSGTFNVISLDGQKLRFTAQAILSTAGGGNVRIDVEGQMDDFRPE